MSANPMTDERKSRIFNESAKAVKACNCCGAPLILRQNKYGKWYPCDAHIERNNDGGEAWVVSSIVGGHRCGQTLAEQVTGMRNAISEMEADDSGWISHDNEIAATKAEIATKEAQIERGTVWGWQLHTSRIQRVAA